MDHSHDSKIYLSSCQENVIFEGMETYSVGEFKAKFSEIIEKVKSGSSVAVTYGKRKEIIGIFEGLRKKKGKRKIGILKGKMTHSFAPDFKFSSEDEFLNP